MGQIAFWQGFPILFPWEENAPAGMSKYLPGLWKIRG